MRKARDLEISAEELFKELMKDFEGYESQTPKLFKLVRKLQEIQKLQYLRGIAEVSEKAANMLFWAEK